MVFCKLTLKVQEACSRYLLQREVTGLVMETKDQSDTEILHLEDKEDVLT